MTIPLSSRGQGLPRPTAPHTVHCAQCLAELPRSGALSMEVEDYVQYYCGLDCLAAWQALEKTQTPNR